MSPAPSTPTFSICPIRLPDPLPKRPGGYWSGGLGDPDLDRPRRDARLEAQLRVAQHARPLLGEPVEDRVVDADALRVGHVAADVAAHRQRADAAQRQR